MVPGLQTMNCQKLLLKRGLKCRMENSFSRHKQLTRKVAKCIDVAEDYIENDSVIESLWLFLYRSCKTFWSPRV